MSSVKMPGGHQHRNPLTFQLSSSLSLKCLPDSSIHLHRDRSFTRATQLPWESERKKGLVLKEQGFVAEVGGVGRTLVLEPEDNLDPVLSFSS